MLNGAGLIWKPTGGELVPPEVVTVTLLVPSVALAAIVNVALIWVALVILMLVTVMPAPALTVAPLTKLEPVRVTGTAAPTMPPVGLMPVSVGGGGLMVKVAGILVPLEVVTVTLAAPVGALAAIAKLAVICVLLTTVTLLTVILAPALTVEPLRKLFPFKVTGTLVPTTPLAGDSDEI